MTHIFSWGIIFILLKLLIYKDSGQLPFQLSLFSTLKIIALYYTIVLFLVPFLLNKKKTGIFIISILSLIITITFVESFFITSFLRLDFMLRGAGSVQEHPQVIIFFAQNLIIAIIIITIKLGTDFRQSRKRIEIIERQKLLVELKYLREQNNPHFLFNNLNNIYFLIDDDPDLAKEMIIKLSNLLRFQLYISNSDKIELAHEIKYIESYISLQKLRHSQIVNVKFIVEGNSDNIQVEPFMIFTFVENAFKHGIDQKLQENNIDIELVLQKRMLELTVKNKIKDNNEIKIDGGFGLESIKLRLDQLYPGKYHLDISADKRLFIINLKLNTK